jgi:hypothetical protein
MRLFDPSYQTPWTEFVQILILIPLTLASLLSLVLSIPLLILGYIVGTFAYWVAVGYRRAWAHQGIVSDMAKSIAVADD